MNVTPDIVRAEMDYRVERALAGTALESVRQARRLHRSWYWRRFEHHQSDQVPTEAARAPLAA